MAISYPTSIDTLTDRASGNTISEDHMNDVQDICEALEAKVGVNSSAVTASIDYKVNKFFIAATHVFFAQATPPVGWSIDASHKDNVLACKSDSGTYSTVGADKGSFTYTGMTNAAEASHNHMWFDFVDTANADSFNSGGSNIAFTGAAGKTGHGPIVIASASHDGPGVDMYTNAGTSHNHVITHDGTDRPKATVGVIATWS